MAGNKKEINSFTGPRTRARTSTSDFGVSKREGHDSSTYYSGRMYDELANQRDVGIENKLPEVLEY